MDFGLASRLDGDRLFLDVSGDLDVLSAPQLRDRLVEAIEGGGRAIFIDLTRCDFIDSSGLSALVSGWKRVQAMGGDLALICPPGNTRRLIELVALDQVFTLYDDLAAVG